jgi:hypothetical protein
VTDIPYNDWEAKVRKIRPDIIYASLNFLEPVKLAYEIITKNLGIPFVWHYKEGPFVCLHNGVWEQLIETYRRADGRIFLNPELKCWYEQFIPQTGLYLIMDGDQPNISYFTNDFSERLSDRDGEIHTVIPGRIMGLGLKDIEILALNKIHIHSYVENYHEIRESFNRDFSDNFHRHRHCSAERWVSEFSKYDAGWLHCFDSHNYGDIKLATWDDFNIPARLSVLASAGIPMIQKNNESHIVAMQSQLQKIDGGIFFKDYVDLANQLLDKQRMEVLRKNVLDNRLSFSFDHHVKELVDFFRQVIIYKHSKL